jgi:hypothetical protein
MGSFLLFHAYGSGKYTHPVAQFNMADVFELPNRKLDPYLSALDDQLRYQKWIALTRSFGRVFSSCASRPSANRVKICNH